MLEELNILTMSISNETPWLLPLCFGMFGACIGSFLNVVIYRLPRGLSVNEPRRSFCPDCRKEIPWYLNIPVISWVMLRGRSACCDKRIPARYCVVELLTALLFAAAAWQFSPDPLPVQILQCVWLAIMLSIFFIDWEKMVVLPVLTNSAAAVGVLCALFAPWLVEPTSLEAGEGLIWSLIGALGGYLLLRLVALLGRLMFGHRSTSYESEQKWSLSQSGDDIELKIGNNRYLWSEIFMEETNRLHLGEAGISIAETQDIGTLTFTPETVILEDGTIIELEQHEELHGTCRSMSTRKEAMGSGDALIAMSIGAMCGWQGVLFALVAGSFAGVIYGVIARVGRGTPMPFGPAFITGAIIYLFFGNILINYYLSSFAN